MSDEKLELERKLRKLNKIQREIGEAKEKRDQKQGRFDGIMERLEREFGVESLEDAGKEIKNLDAQLTRRTKRITEDFETLQEEYELD